jgi:glycosyltransferase involved in cell wall biosynthesis
MSMSPTTTTELTIIVPVLNRPQNVRPLLESIEDATPAGIWEVLFVCDPGDDPERDAIEAAIEEFGERRVDYTLHAGNYAAKINHGARMTMAPLLFLGADDLKFHRGWFLAARRCLSDRIGVVGTNDLCNQRVIAGNHSTHSLVARWYAEIGTIDEGGKILHEGYPHEFVDDEFVETAKFRGAYAHAHDSVVEHMHPMVGKAPTDELYDAMPIRMKLGRAVYLKRRRMWRSMAA